MFYCLVVGSRSFDDYDKLCEVLDSLLINQIPDITIVSGGARGADRLAERYAREHKFSLRVFPANWDLGSMAGYLRNEQMHRFIAQQEKRGVVAFWDGQSRGTQHNFGLAQKYNNPIRIARF